MSLSKIVNMKNLMLVLLCAGAFLFQSHQTKIFETSEVVEETWDLDKFHKLGVAGSFKVNLKQGSKQKVVVRGEKEFLDKMNKEVRNGEWNIKIKQNKWYKGKWKRQPIEVDVVMERVSGIGIAGSGKVKIHNTIVEDELKLSISGSGYIYGKIKTSELKSSISGSGGIDVSGSSNHSKISISGSGSFDGSDLAAKNAKISIAGSGDVNIHVDQSIKVSIAGSGNVKYSGNPENVNVSSAGSGKVRKI